MLKGQDIVVLLTVAGRPGWTIAAVAEGLGLSTSAVHRSVERAIDAHLMTAPGRDVNANALEELLVHASRYLFPARLAGPSRGVPTAWSAPPLSMRLARVDEDPLVWPDPAGSGRGIALEPIHPSVPFATRGDAALHERLALVDALRAGGARVRREAAEALHEHLAVPAAP
ncbi:MAG TPA: helix-turn-helix domain-containing protein [Miltoncostaeaceae bacterium]|nr:helix-turn-helix domain-containing protein [Miltoncostaeaceae bacterium]